MVSYINRGRFSPSVFLFSRAENQKNLGNILLSFFTKFDHRNDHKKGF